MLKIKYIAFITSIIAFFISISKNYYYQNIKEKEIIETTINEITGDYRNKEEKIKTNKNNKKKKVNNEYKIIIEIPKINLKKGIYSKERKKNNVDKNVTILDYSVYPGEEGNIYIAAHSGNGIHSYFNNIDKLRNKDKVNLYYNNKKYTYIQYDTKYIDKKKMVSFLTNGKNNLFLITCSRKYKNKYLVLYLKGQ